MSAPDVRVRLTPEGIKEVLAGLRKVQEEAKKAERASKRGLGGFAKQLGALKRFLPTLGFGAAVAGIVAMGRQALKAAKDLKELSIETGASAENLSVLIALSSEFSDSSADAQTTLVRLNQQLIKLRNGVTSAGDAFAQLDLGGEDFINLDSVEAVEKVAIALSKIDDPIRKVAAAQQLLGKAGVRLLPTLEKLAEQGLAGATDKAKELGLFMSSQLVEDAAAANRALKKIGDSSKALALSFISELAPAITQAMTEVSDATAGKGLSAFRIFGKGVGKILGAIVNLFRLFAGVVNSTFELVGTTIGALFASLSQAVRGNFAEAKTIISEGFADIAEINRKASLKINDDLGKLVNDLINDPPKVEIDPEVTLKTPDPIEFKAIVAARLAAAKSRAKSELALQRELLTAQEDANQRAFDQNLISLQQFTDKRREILQRAAAVEIAALQLSRDAIAATVDTTSVGPSADAARIRATEEIAALNNRIQVRQLALSRELAELEGDRIDAARSVADAQAGTAIELAELEGRRHDAFTRHLAQEIRDIRELGIRAGQTAAEIEATVDRFTQARTSRFNFDEVSRAAEAALDSFSRDAAQIRLDQESGVTTQFTGELRLIELQRQRLEVLNKLAQASLDAALATGDPQLIRQAEAYKQSIDAIAASLKAATDTTFQLKQGGLEAFEEGLSSLLANIQDVESLEDAFKSLARSVANSLQKIASEILARQAIFALLGAFGGGGGILGSIATGRTGGYIRGYAGGGDIAGPRLPLKGPDKIPILAAEGEFMMRRSRVKEPGALDFLRSWNSGRFTLRQAMMLPRFQSGGLVGAAQPIGERAEKDNRGANIRMVNVVDPELALAALDTPSGEEVILNIISRNGDRIQQGLGS